MAKGRKEIEALEEEGENWLASYADMITDLLAIFVILFSFAMANQAVVTYKAKMAEEGAAVELAQESAESELLETNDWQDMEARQASIPTPPPTPAVTGPFITLFPSEVVEDESDNGLYRAIREYIETSGLTGELSVEKQADGMILLRIHSSIFFKLGSAEIESSADQILIDVCKIFVDYEEQIKMLGIEGHTDNLPINTQQYDSNWELSTARAVNVLRRVLTLSGIDPTKFSAVGLGEFHPIADNDTEAGRAQNRRVDFIIDTIGD